jgi:nucleotide-binding universal stress UspA family protein
MSSTKKEDPQATGVTAEEHIDPHTSEKIASVAASATHSRTIMIALDTSPYSEQAFEWALTNIVSKDNKDLVVLVTVREPVLVPGAYGYMDFGDYIAEAEEQSRLRSHALIKKYGQRLLKHFGLDNANSTGLTIKGIVMRGDPRDELVRKAHELNATALVLGSRGLGGFKRAFLGSVSDYLAHHCQTPVIIVKSDAKPNQQ